MRATSGRGERCATVSRGAAFAEVPEQQFSEPAATTTELVFEDASDPTPRNRMLRRPARAFRLSPMAADASYFEMVVRLGREFVRRGMHEHARALRLYYVALRAGLAQRGAKVDVRWDRALTEEWMKTLRLHPFDGHYEVRLPGVPCLRCRAPKGNDRSSARTEVVFPGGARMRCDCCGARWLVDEGNPDE